MMASSITLTRKWFGSRVSQRIWVEVLLKRREFIAKKPRLVLGASSGIGRELAKELARLCPSVSLVLSARREEELESLAAELNLDPSQYLALPLDLEQHKHNFESKLKLVLHRFGHLDVLINNAGISQRSLIKDTVYSVDSRLISINYLGTVTLSKNVLPVMAAIISICIHLIDIVSSISWNINEDITWWLPQPLVTLAQRFVPRMLPQNMLYTDSSNHFAWNTLVITSTWQWCVPDSLEQTSPWMHSKALECDTEKWIQKPMPALIRPSVHERYWLVLLLDSMRSMWVVYPPQWFTCVASVLDYSIKSYCEWNQPSFTSRVTLSSVLRCDNWCDAWELRIVTWFLLIYYLHTLYVHTEKKPLFVCLTSLYKLLCLENRRMIH